MLNETPRSIFKKLLQAMELYAANVTSTAEKFRTDYAEAARYAAAYKDEKRILSDKRTKLSAKAREEVNRYGASLGEAAAECVKALNDCLEDHLVKPVPAATEKLLNLYSRYKLPMSKSELDAALTVNAGHLTGLRLLNAMLKECGSQYEIDFVELSQYENDIQDLARFALLAEFEPAFPMEYLHEAALIYCGQKELEVVPAKDVKTTNVNGSEYGKAGDVIRTNELNKAAHQYRIKNGKAVETMTDMDINYLSGVSVDFSMLYKRIVGGTTKGENGEEKEVIGMAQYWIRDLGRDFVFNDDVVPEARSGTQIVLSEDPAMKNAADMRKYNAPVSKETLEKCGMK